MNESLQAKYRELSFPPDVAIMFADIIESDEAAKKVCFFIGKALQKQKNEEHSFSGVTISEIVENVKLERKTRSGKGKNYTYNTTTTNIHRKTAENIVDKLLDMSLLHYKSIKPYKFIFLTRRGVQVLEELLKRSKQSNTRSVQ
ncbi:hypothetical protein ACFVAD_18850 [Sutcliffiella sp. NPDC057660]|uniref:hypothetical protein n=1 Tax=Sutcliffiella sp. NPDC057660 TaxID=3346199 RepID=UPI0036A7D49D